MKYILSVLFGFFSILVFAQCPPPTQSYDLNITAETDVSITISWTSGSGGNRVVLIKQGKSVSASPSDNTTYTANTVFGSGTQVGTGNYTVYNSSGSSVLVTGLTANTIYTFKVFEYNGGAGSELYNIQSSQGNPLSEYSFTTEYQAVITRAGVRSFTTPVIGDQIHDNRLLRRNKLDGIHNELDDFHYTANSQQNFGLLNWVTPASNEATLIGSPTFTPDQGITGNGTSSYINWNFTPSQGVQFTRNSCSFGTFSTNTTGTGSLTSAVVTTPIRISLAPTSIFINSNSARTGTNATIFGVYHAVRTSSTNTNYFKSLKQILGNGTENSNGDINTTVYGNARHNTTAGDVADSYGTYRIGANWFGDQILNERNQMYANIIARYYKHVPLLGTVSKTGITAVDFFGDSFTVGQAANPIGTQAYVKQFMAYQFSAITETNHAVSGRGCWVAADAVNQKAVNNGATELWIEMCGQNDIDKNGSATKTVNKHEAWIRTMFINHAANAFVAAGSSSATRTGAYSSASYDARSQGGRFTSAALPANSATVNSGGTAGTVSYTTTSTSLGVQLISDYGSGTFGTCTISIDGVPQNTVDLSSYYDGISDGSNNNQTGPVAFWYVGLTNASHTITVTSNADGMAPVDFFATLMLPSAMMPMIICENPYRNVYVKGSNVAMDGGSARKFAVAQLLSSQGFPVVYYSLNKYYDRDDIDADNVHPANGGHRQIAGGLNHLFDGY
jgi:hypothetical protein